MKRCTLVGFAAFSLIATCNASADTMYKCRSADGSTTYALSPCGPGSKQVGQLYVEGGKPASSLRRAPSDPLEAANALADTSRRRAAAVQAGAFSTVPDPKPDPIAGAGPSPDAPTLESTRPTFEGPGPRLLRESGTEEVFAVMVVIVLAALIWGLIKILVPLARGATRAAGQAAVEVAPTVKYAAERVSDTAAVRTKGFFAETRKCPYCAEAIVCRFCHRSLT